MGIFQRVSDIFKSNLNSMLDNAEDPEKMIAQAIREMEVELGRATSGAAKAIGSEKQLKNELERHRQEAEVWHQRAVQALETGREELAAKALGRKKEEERLAEGLQPQWEQANDLTQKLKTQIGQLKSKIEEAKRRKGQLAARQRAAEAQKSVSKTLGSLGAGRTAFSTFDRMEEKVREMEAESQAMTELQGGGEDELEKEFDNLDSDVSAELAALKNELAAKKSGL
ncbi:MAG: PspA/IM30 family protein [Planctomycetota bacterium]